MVYEPFLGLCTVSGSSRETMLGVEHLFYELKPRHGASAVKVPAGQMSSRGIRSLMAPQEIEHNLRAQAEKFPLETSEYGRQRLRRWTQIVRSDKQSGVYEFLREFHGLASQGVKLDPREVEMQEKVHRSLSQEIALVLEISIGKASVRLNQWLERK